MKSIVTTPTESLLEPSKAVTTFSKNLTELIEQMKETLLATRNPKGVGLAAPQIGVNERVFITKESTKAPIRVFINPQIVSKSPLEESKEGKLEGCLSIPKVWGKVKRSSTVTIRYQDEAGLPHEETIKGFLATIIQHETDHIDGILFTRRVLEQKEKLYQSVIGEDKEELREITI